MKCSAFKELVGAYALGALDAGERADFERHLEEAGPHEGCREELARAIETAEHLPLALPAAAVGDHVWRGIERRLTSSGSASSAPRGTISRREALGWFAAAASLLGLYFARESEKRALDQAEQSKKLLVDIQSAASERDRCLKELEHLRSEGKLQHDIVAMLEKPTTRVVPLLPAKAGTPGRASAIMDMDGPKARAFVMFTAMEIVPDKDFQLWVIRGSTPPAPAGFMRAAGAGLFMGEIDPRALATGAPDVVAISLEPLGGAPVPAGGGTPAPSEVLVLGKVKG